MCAGPAGQLCEVQSEFRESNVEQVPGVLTKMLQLLASNCNEKQENVIRLSRKRNNLCALTIKQATEEPNNNLNPTGNPNDSRVISGRLQAMLK